MIVCALLGLPLLLQADPPTELVLKTESFDRDPGWEGMRNRLRPKEPAIVTQDFGWSKSNFAGNAPGEMGGRIARSVTPAYYGDRISPRSFRQPLVAAGSFALIAGSQSSADVFFGWFNSDRQGWRPANFLGFRIDATDKQAHVFVDYTTATFKAGSLDTKLTIPVNGEKHHWKLVYDPKGNNGDGLISFTLDKLPPKTLPLSAGHQWESAEMNRFGMFNLQSPGGTLVIYFDDLEYDGKKEDFRTDPHWDGMGNRLEFKDYDVRDAQDFGWSPTNHAGRTPGEIGGTFWRTEPDEAKFGYYADRVGPFSFRDPLYASGQICVTRAATDSGLYIGWFDATAGGEPPEGFIGLHIEGPSRVGHYFRLEYRNHDGDGADSQTGPIIRPDGKKHSWTLLYDPHANDGHGAMRATFDGEVVTLAVKPGHKTGTPVLDRFGFRTMRRGGHYATMYLDDLKYTVGHRREPSARP